MRATAIILGALAGLVWIAQMSTLFDMSGSDAAGNGMAQGFVALEIIVLWVLLAVLLVLACVAGKVPVPIVLPGLVVLPLSGVAAMRAMDLLTEPNSPPFLWPIIVSAVVPVVIALFCIWALVPPARTTVPGWFVAGAVWSAAILVSASVWPMAQIRQAVVVQQQIDRDNWAADFAKLPPDAPLWDRTPFLATPDDTRQAAVLEGIRQLDNRQSDAETMLDRGDFPLFFLGQMDLTPTSAICDKARALLRRQVEPLVLQKGETKPYATIRQPVANAAQAMEWLVGYGCSCDAEALAWETMANAYSNTEWDVVRLRQVRDPKVLGRVLRETPARFDMLSPQSHLKAWLHFAENPKLHDQAMAGARALDHRTEDAVEILGGTEFDAWDLLIVLPDLDLQATPDLCEAALREVHRELAALYRPGRDDPRPYEELLERMGTGEPLRALIWLSQRGCDTGDEVVAARQLVGAYQNSPERAAMLGELQPKP